MPEQRLLPPNDPGAALRVFAAPSRGPGAAVPVVILAVTVAALAMHVDRVAHYSNDAFAAGIVGSALFAVGVTRVIASFRDSAWRGLVSFFLPAFAGAVVGVVVQAFVLAAMQHREPLRDLGGAIDTMHPLGWLLGGILLGGIPALAVSLFLALAGRAQRRLRALDASERFTVGFTGIAGVIAAFGTTLVDRLEAIPLFFGVIVAFGAVIIAVLVDGARLRALRHAFAGDESGYELVPLERFQSHALASLVEPDTHESMGAHAERVLVRIDPRPDYRHAAVEPIALVGYDERATCEPITRRRIGASAMLVAMGALGTVGASIHGLFM